jgi:hypothetical protein
MSYVRKIMADTEHEVYSTHQHYIVLFQRLITSLFAFLVFLGLGLAMLTPKADEPGNQVRFTVGVIALGSLVMPLYLIASAWLQGLRGRELVERIWRAALVRIFFDWLNERYIITNRRVMEVKGIINKNVSDSALEKVNDVKMQQSMVGRVLGYGTVQIITGSDIGVNSFHRISNPVRFKREMLNAKERLHEPVSPLKPEQAPDFSPPTHAVESTTAEPDAEAAARIPDLIVELAELRQKGIISETEFQAKKKELLDRL